MTRKEYNQKLLELSESEDLLHCYQTDQKVSESAKNVNEFKEEPLDYPENWINNDKVEDYRIDDQTDQSIENDFVNDSFIDDSTMNKEKYLNGQKLDTNDKFIPVHEQKNENYDKMLTQKHSC